MPNSNYPPNPMQPLMNELVKIRCALDTMAKMNGGGTAVTVQFPKTSTARPKGMKLPAGLATKILDMNPNRNSFALTNASAVTDIYLGTDNTVTDINGGNPGYPLLPANLADDDKYTGEVWAWALNSVWIFIWEE
jgi:hypothetical protein